MTSVSEMMRADRTPNIRPLAFAAGLVAVLFIASCDQQQPAATPAPNTPQPSADPNNAAPRYVAIAQGLDKSFVEQVQQLVRAEDPKLTPEVVAALRSNSTAVNGVISASKLVECDFGIRNADLTTLLPYLGQVRTLARLLKADAMRCASEGDQNGAAARAAAAIRMGHQVSGAANCLIDSLVGMATTAVGLGIVKEQVRIGAVDPAAKSELAAALNALNPSDPAGIRASIPKERDGLLSSFRNNHFPDGEGLGRDWSKATQSERASTAGDLEKAFEQIIQVWDRDDAVTQIERIQASIPNRSKDIMPDLSKARASATKFAVEVDETKKLLK